MKYLLPLLIPVYGFAHDVKPPIEWQERFEEQCKKRERMAQDEILANVDKYIMDEVEFIIARDLRRLCREIYKEER